MARAMTIPDWLPSATPATLRRRADLLASIRQFFNRRGVLEVDVPLLGVTGVTEVNIQGLTTTANGAVSHLQTSPEYYMKRLLAAGMGSIYNLGKVFRDGERGRRHNTEFTLLEWYRPGWDEHQLMAELAELISAVGFASASMPGTHTYGSLFSAVTGCDPHRGDLARLRQLAVQWGGDNWAGAERSACLDVIFSLAIEPQLPRGLVFVRDYPACQCALATVHRDQSGDLVARRFEAFIDGTELANGYFELTDPVEQRHRFEADNALRRERKLPVVELDDKLLAALRVGLPASAGVALGVDRLLMAILGLDHVGQAVPFYDL